MAIAGRRIQVEDDLVFNDYVTAGEESNRGFRGYS